MFLQQEQGVGRCKGGNVGQPRLPPITSSDWSLSHGGPVVQAIAAAVLAVLVLPAAQRAEQAVHPSLAQGGGWLPLAPPALGMG